MDGNCLSDALHVKWTRLPSHQLIAQPFHQRIQRDISERGKVLQPCVSRICSENFFQSTLEERQFDEHHHGFKRLRGQRFPAAVVGSASRREKERPLPDPMSNPRSSVLPLLKLDLT